MRADVVPSPEVQLTMTRGEARTLYEIATLNVTVPDAVYARTDIRYAEAQRVLGEIATLLRKLV